MFVDRGKLMLKMCEKHLTRLDLSIILGICEASACAKVKGKQQFSESECAKLHEIFGNDVFIL